jgi:hypothetical protein
MYLNIDSQDPSVQQLLPDEIIMQYMSPHLIPTKMSWGGINMASDINKPIQNS